MLHIPTSRLRDGDTTLTVPDNDLDKIQLDFLRFVAGGAASATSWSLLQEFGMDPLQVHWAACILRFWNDLRDMPDSITALTARADLELMVHGNNKLCWSFKVCRFLSDMGLVADSYRVALQAPLGRRVPFPHGTVDYFWSMRINVNDTVDKLRTMWRERIVLAVSDRTSLLRQCPRRTKFYPKYCAYMRWVGLRQQGTGRHPHLHMHIPSHKHKVLIRFRLGCWNHLAVHNGRFIQSHMPRHRRICRKCAMRQSSTATPLHDELHVALECPHYAPLRAKYPTLFDNPLYADHEQYDADACANAMQSLLNHANEHMVAEYINELYHETLQDS
jgi:hypothetical protein